MEKDFRVELPEAVETVIHKLESAGYEAWCVGGCVRDSLLGKTPFDWDVTTNARPEETKACFAGGRVVEVGAAHGTVAVVGENGHPIEITTFRTETGYSDGRHPDSVTFAASLEEDLSRRDFTVNAMAYHPQRGLVDLFDGQRDLKGRRLSCVGEPDRRFSEDALRILRCLRFSSQLGFEIEEQTSRSLVEKRDLLRALSQERVRDELTKLLCGESVEGVLRKYAQVVFTVLPQLSPMKGCTQETPYHCYDVWEHTIRVVSHSPRNQEIRWAALLHDGGKPAKKTFSPDGVAHFCGHPPESGRIAREVLEQLRFSNRQRDRIGFLVDHHEDKLPMEQKQLKLLLGRYGEEAVFQLLDLMESDMWAKAAGVYERRLPDIVATRRLAQEILERGDCLTLKQLAINGKELKALGVPTGPAMGNVLQKALEEVLEGKIPNQTQALKEYVLGILEGQK